jgi:Peptidase family M28
MHSFRVVLGSLFIFAILLSTSIIAYSIPPAETDSAMAYLKVLADPDLFQGRKSGSEGGTASQEWVAGKFATWSLQPFIGDNLLHRFDMLATTEKKARLKLLDTQRYGDVDFLLGTDFALTVNSGTGKVTAPVVLVGHGISKPDKGWDDYGDVNLDGKIIVIIRGKPSNGEDWDHEYTRTYLLNEAKEHNVAGVLFYMGEEVIGGAAIMETAYDEDLPTAVIGKNVMNHLLYGTGFTFDIYNRVLKKSPRVLDLGKRVTLEAKVERIKDGFGYSVVGMVPGTDPELAKEVVLFGGHGDHVGENALGHLYLGADDNGSGTCVVMELARVFAANPQPRTMVFMSFGGEEQGLLGSEAVAADLPDGFNYIAMINLDMAGRGEGITGIGGGNAMPAIWYDFYSSLSDSMRGQIQQRRAWGGFSSDHAHFREAGIPAFTSYSKGSHDHYHSTEDTYETIDTRAIEGSLNALGTWLEALASHPESLVEEYQPERVVWHRGYGFRWAELSENIKADFEAADAAAHEGYSATVLTTYAPSNDVESILFEETLDWYRDALAQRSELNLGKEFKDARDDAYNLRGTVFLAVDGDNLSSADSTRMDYWDALGLHWVQLTKPSAWLSTGNVRFDKLGIVQAWKRLNTIVQLPLDVASEFMPLVGELSNVLFVGDWTTFSAFNDEMLGELEESGARIMLTVSHEDLSSAKLAIDRLHELKVHLQPSSTDYTESLSWIRLALEVGVEKEHLLTWIGGHYGKW